MADSTHDLDLLFQASLSPDIRNRHAAESQLNSLSDTPGFVSALFSLVASSDKELPIRQAAAVYLKNHIRVSYAPSGLPKPNTASKVSDTDRVFLKQHLLDGLATVPTSIRTLLVPPFAVVLSTDYPDQWPELLPQVASLISSNEYLRIEAGLLALVELMRLYRWSGHERSELRTQVITLTFPILLRLAESLLSQAPEGYTLLPAVTSPAEANSKIGSLIYLILKVYKTSITAELQPFLQQNIVPWGQLLLTVVRHPLQASPGFPADSDDRERWGWTKAKKWAYFILNRLYSRYGSPSQLPQTMLQYRSFAQNFISCFACPILRLYLEQVERYVQGQDWISRKVICHTIVFFEESIRPKETWVVLKVHIQALLPRFIFPLICITPEEIQEFEEQPEEYAKTQFGEFFEDICSIPSTMASGFVLALASGRKKTMFMSLLTFITDICVKYQAEKNARDKDGALRTLACLATVVTETKSLRSNIEEFFSTYVFPEFHSDQAFLRARACEVIRKFEIAGSEWTNQEFLNIAYQGVTQCLSDRSLPVRIQAALTLPEISEHPQIHNALVPHIGSVMQGILRLSNEVDLDSLTQSARRLVSSFSNELLPFAADMSHALHQSYMRLMAEITDARERLGDDEDDDTCEEKVLVAMNILKTLQQLVVGLEGNPTVLYQVEAAAIPLIKYTLKEEIVEIYDEALELLDSIQFALKSITGDQWSLFEIIYHIFKTSGADFITEMFPCLDNFVNYGSGYLAACPDQLQKILDIYLTTITSSGLGCSDRVIACKLADSVLLCMRGHADEAIPMFLKHTMLIIQRGITTVDPVTTKSLFMHSLEVVLNSIYYNPKLSMAVLIENGWSSDFFGEWFARLSSFNRTHDKKLSLLAICSLLSTSLGEGAESILVQSCGQLLIGALTLFETLPGSIRRRYELEGEYSRDSDDSDDGNTTVDDGSTKDEHDEEDDEDVIDIPDLKYRGFTPSRRRDENGEDDRTIPPSSLWSDEILWETPLDRVDAYNEFARVMKNIENSGHPIINIINESLSTDQRTNLQRIFAQAGSGGEISIKNEIQQSIQANHYRDRL